VPFILPFVYHSIPFAEPLLNITMRPQCPVCNTRKVAINYKKNGVIHYRSKCDPCARKNKKIVPKWVKTGYRKKIRCECCNFKSQFPEQMDVCFIDGDEKNTAPSNLRTVCLNCYATVVTLRLGWQFAQRGLKADL